MVIIIIVVRFLWFFERLKHVFGALLGHVIIRSHIVTALDERTQVKRVALGPFFPPKRIFAAFALLRLEHFAAKARTAAAAQNPLKR